MLYVQNAPKVVKDEIENSKTRGVNSKLDI